MSGSHGWRVRRCQRLPIAIRGACRGQTLRITASVFSIFAFSMSSVLLAPDPARAEGPLPAESSVSIYPTVDGGRFEGGTVTSSPANSGFAIPATIWEAATAVCGTVFTGE